MQPGRRVRQGTSGPRSTDRRDHTMYAMDTAVHLEHRTETRRSRWDLRRSVRPASTPTAEPAPAATTTTDSPVHDFVD